jgi:hypothetical protein
MVQCTFEDRVYGQKVAAYWEDDHGECESEKLEDDGARGSINIV